MDDKIKRARTESLFRDVNERIAESAQRPALCRWFTSLVAKSAHLPELEKALAAARATEVRVIPMRHGQKHSRILAWRFA